MARDQYIEGTAAAVRGKSKEKEKGWFAETALKGLEGGLDFTEDLLLKSKDVRDNEEIKEKAEELLKEAVMKEAEGMVGEIPYGRAIIVAIKLSKAFADGVGEALTEVNDKLAAEYDKPIHDELTPQDIETIQSMRRYQLRACQELNGILLRGVKEAGKEALSEIKDWLTDKASDMVNDICGQLADNLLKQNDLVGLASEATKKAAEAIPEGHKKVLGIAFKFASSTLVGQLGGEKMKKKLAPLLGAAASEKSIDVALLNGLIKVMVQGAWRQYAKQVQLDEAENEVAGMLDEQANVIFTRLSSTYTPSRGAGSEVRISGSTIEIPNQVFGEVTQGKGETIEELRRWIAMHDQLNAFIDGQVTMLKCKQIKYQWQINHLRKYDVAGARSNAAAQAASDAYVKLSSDFVDEQNAAYERTRKMIQSIVDEFGKQFDGITTDRYWSLSLNRLPHGSDSLQLEPRK